MSRKGSPGTRSILPDPKHGSEVVARFINMVMSVHTALLRPV